MGTYHPESMIATEFIDDAEIQETLEFGIGSCKAGRIYQCVGEAVGA